MATNPSPHDTAFTGLDLTELAKMGTETQGDDEEVEQKPAYPSLDIEHPSIQFEHCTPPRDLHTGILSQR